MRNVHLSKGHLIEFTQEEGEVVYVPDNWAHAVLNLEPCVGVSKQVCECVQLAA